MTYSMYINPTGYVQVVLDNNAMHRIAAERLKVERVGFEVVNKMVCLNHQSRFC